MRTKSPKAALACPQSKLSSECGRSGADELPTLVSLDAPWRCVWLRRMSGLLRHVLIGADPGGCRAARGARRQGRAGDPRCMAAGSRWVPAPGASPLHMSLGWQNGGVAR